MSEEAESVLEHVADNTWAVMRMQGEWYAKSMSSYGPWVVEDFETLMFESNARREPVNLMFNDRRQITAFLDDPNPQLASWQQIVRMARQHWTTVAMTRHEFEWRMRDVQIIRPSGRKISWHDSFRWSTVDAAKALRVPSCNNILSNFIWVAKEVLEDPVRKFQFERMLKAQGALGKILGRRIQDVYEPEKAIVNHEWVYEGFAEFGDLTLLVPYYPGLPIRRIYPGDRSVDLYQEAPSRMLAQIYHIESPAYDSAGGIERGWTRKWKRQSQMAVPFDLMAANA